MNTKSPHPHNGHRVRLRSLIDKVGLKSLSDVQIVEQILTMTNARCDTNETAHRLLDEFGSISKILDASVKDLEKVKGVGKVTAQMLTYLPQIFELYVQDKNKRKHNCKTFGDVYDYFSEIFKTHTKECFVVAFVGPNNVFEDYEILSEGSFSSVSFDVYKLSATIVKHNANGIIIAHNHPFGSATPSKADYDSHLVIEKMLTSLGIPFINNVIIGNDGMYSFKDGNRIMLKNLQ